MKNIEILDGLLKINSHVVLFGSLIVLPKDAERLASFNGLIQRSYTPEQFQSMETFLELDTPKAVETDYLLYIKPIVDKVMDPNLELTESDLYRMRADSR